jgi:hypothetical protein
MPAAESFLQEWLFFGLMYEVLNSCGAVLENFDDFVLVGDDGKKLVTTSRLPEYIEKWQTAEKALSDDCRMRVLAAVNGTLTEARVIVGKLTLVATDYSVTLPMDDSILLSIVILGETLEFSKMNIFKNFTGGPAVPMSYWGNRHFLGRLLRDLGCCPNQIRMFESTVSAATMYYAYRADLLQDGRNHEKCNTDGCVAYQIDPRTYKTLHKSRTCTCEHVEPPINKIKSILAKGGFPLISFASPITSCDDLNIDVIEASSDVPFVAISHVWSDGLGNPSSNSLPKCQLRYLRARVTDGLWEQGAKGASRVHLWIDTLCIPLEEPLRGRAVESIKKTFECATEVLVLDSKLKNLSRSTPYTENLMRVSCTGWLRRLWTFLEGVLAKKLMFQFVDGAVEVRVWMYECYKDLSTNLWNLVPVDASQFYWLLRSLNRHDTSKRFARIWNALQWRSTSRASDESICVASLFGLDLPEIVRAPVEQRMKRLLEMQEWFPPGIVFMDGERMQEDGLGWAPKSFMARRENEFGLLDAESLPAYFDEHGLYVTFSGFLVKPTQRPLSDIFFLLNEDSGSTYLVQWQRERHSMKWDVLGPHVLRRPAILTSRDAAHKAESVGILVNIYREEDECLYVKFKARILVRTEPAAEYAHHFDSYQGEALADIDEFLYAIGTPFASDQQWCVG